MTHIPNEILQIILKNEDGNINFLHTCLFINKTWSSNVVQILWNRPFCLLKDKISSHCLVSTYLSCLNDEEISSLTLENVSLSFFDYNKTLYFYPSFLRHLSYFSFLILVQSWCAVHDNWNISSFCKVVNSLLVLFSKNSKLECLDFMVDLSVLKNKLINQVIRNGRSSGKLDITILRNSEVSSWISKINEIKLSRDFVIHPDFKNIVSLCVKIEKMEIRMDSSHYFGYGGSEFIELIEMFIKNQTNLISFTLGDGIIQKEIVTLLSQESSLVQLKFINPWFEPSYMLPCFKKLKSISFISTIVCTSGECYDRSKRLTTEVPNDSFKLVGENLQEIEIRSSGVYTQKDLIGSISCHCPYLRKLGIVVTNEEIPSLITLLERCRFLNVLVVYGTRRTIDMTDYFPKLGLALPLDFSELIIEATCYFTPDCLETFFINIQHVTLHKIVIKNFDFINDDHLKIFFNQSLNLLEYVKLQDRCFSISREELENARRYIINRE